MIYIVCICFLEGNAFLFLFSLNISAWIAAEHIHAKWIWHNCVCVCVFIYACIHWRWSKIAKSKEKSSIQLSNVEIKVHFISIYSKFIQFQLAKRKTPFEQDTALFWFSFLFFNVFFHFMCLFVLFDADHLMQRKC